MAPLFRSPPLALVALLAAASTHAAPASDEPTWARDVAPILFRHCASCHRPGEVAPFPLLTFDDAAAHARQAARVVESRVMPPWLAEKSDPPFSGERRLSDAEVATLVAWAKAGAPSGDLASAPPPPSFTPGWQLGVPDLVLTMPEPFVVPDRGPDLYRNFVIHVPTDRMRYVKAVEIRPGNSRVVHHGVLKQDASDSSRRADAKDALPGFDEMDVGEAASPDGQFLGWTPGRTPKPLSEGMAWRLRPGADLVLQLHLLPSGKPEPVQASVGLFFTDETPTRWPIMLRLGSRSIDLPAGARDFTIDDEFTLPVDVDYFATAPHAHFLGESVSAWATLPDGTRRTLVEIRRWNFSWQDEFRFVEPLPLPAGTKLSMRWTYDNSDQNPRNPSRPPQRVFYGPSSRQEMCDVWMQVVPRSRADFEKLEREFERKDLAAVRAGLELEAARTPDDAEVRFSLGMTKAQQGEVDAARRELERSIELAPRSARAHVQLGFVLERLHELDRARAELEAALAIEPAHGPALNELGALAEARGDVATAESCYERAAKARPELFQARVNWARLLARRGEDGGAAREYAAALALDPSAQKVRSELVWLLSTSSVDAARDGAKAVELARDLVPRGSDDPQLLDVLAAAQAEARRFKAAAETATRALELARRHAATQLAAAIEQRLELYRQSKPYRAPPRASR